ncbi:AEC family transporter [Nioella sediminis]|uniref:AEC family transporter n=1 Tax=Nioella sediminis TaxID=1912092 RepID=UPI0008FD684C|nr:AEC family transporter [Nioella sediminis]TBX28228.1 transporter [Roseovarius sp. JS7-11]
MNLVLTVLEIVAPVFLLAATGFGWRKFGLDYPVEFVTRLAMTIAVPCLIFTALMQTEIDPAALSAMTLASLLAYALMGVLSAGLILVAGIDRRTFLAPTIFGNTGNLGLPLALFAFGDVGLGYGVVIFAIMAVLSFTIGIRLVSDQASILRVLREPMVWATLLGALFLWQGWQTPRWLTNSLSLAGQLAIPLMLFTLGVAVARLTPRGVGRAVMLSLAKLAIGITAGAAAGWALGLEQVAFAVIILQMATPVGVSSYLLAERFRANADAVAGYVVISTLISVLALPILLYFLL